MSKNKTQLQAELSALGEQLGVPVNIEQTKDELSAAINELQQRLAAQDDELQDEQPAGEDTAAPAEDEEMVILRAVKTFQTTDLGEKIVCRKGETVIVTAATARLCIADRVAVSVAE